MSVRAVAGSRAANERAIANNIIGRFLSFALSYVGRMRVELIRSEGAV